MVHLLVTLLSNMCLSVLIKMCIDMRFAWFNSVCCNFIFDSDLLLYLGVPDFGHDLYVFW